MAYNPRGIVTPEAVVLDFETAGIASRALARVLDALIQAAALLALVLLAVSLPGTVAVVVAIVGVAAIVLGYPILCETLMRGRSPGKAALGLRVVTVEGAPVSARHAFIRSALGIVDFLLPPGGLFATVSALLSPRGQRLGDLVAGTIVLRERTATSPAMAVWFNPPAGLEGYAQTLDVTSVTDGQFAVVRSFLLRVHELAPEARSAMSLRLATPVAAAMHHQAPAGVPPELFLVSVAAAYQRRRSGGLPVASPVAAPDLPPPPPTVPATGPGHYVPPS
ncbi:MAG: RDD family protein [Acidimicrobiales bacterium]